MSEDNENIDSSQQHDQPRKKFYLRGEKNNQNEKKQEPELTEGEKLRQAALKGSTITQIETPPTPIEIRPRTKKIPERYLVPQPTKGKVLRNTEYRAVKKPYFIDPNKYGNK